MKEHAGDVKYAIFHNVSRSIRRRMAQKLDAFIIKHEELNCEFMSALSTVQLEIAKSVCWSEKARYEAMKSLKELSQLKDSLYEEIIEWETSWLLVSPLLPMQVSQLGEDVEKQEDDDNKVSDGKDNEAAAGSLEREFDVGADAAFLKSEDDELFSAWLPGGDKRPAFLVEEGPNKRIKTESEDNPN